MDGFAEFLNIGREKPPIPELPKTIGKLNALLRKDFKVLRISEPVSAYGGEYHPGGVAITNIGLECPFCGMKFKATRRIGCFLGDLSPNTCPNCHFPGNVLQAAMSLWEKKKKEGRETGRGKE
ncbi:MAG: hypothetical protein A2922_01640 [Candidatus Nealsonbacteria bacterium RIFCSPLOWO2_01_FULL_43_36]|nr:MAG: hypothetical protein A2922_01640 [Candidatus Nealsonbacteria bacterium RIFCSPLOWO2_01_FULL_43_36]